MVGVGLTAVAARRFGEARADEASRIAGDALLFSLLLGLGVAIVGRSEISKLCAMINTPDDVTSLGTTYLSTFLIGTPLVYGFFAVDAAFRASGDTRTPFVLLFASGAITLLPDPVL